MSKKFTSELIIKDFNKKIEKFIEFKEPELNNTTIRDDIALFIKSLNENEKIELIQEIDKVLSKDILFNEIKFTSSLLSDNKPFINVLYRMAKYEMGEKIIELRKELQQKQQDQYKDYSEKQLLIEIIKILKSITNYG